MYCAYCEVHSCRLHLPVELAVQDHRHAELQNWFVCTVLIWHRFARLEDIYECHIKCCVEGLKIIEFKIYSSYRYLAA